MTSRIWRGNISWLSGKWCGWLLEDLHSRQLSSETFRLEVDLPSPVCCDLHSPGGTCVDHWDPVCPRVLGYSLCPNRHQDWTITGTTQYLGLQWIPRGGPSLDACWPDWGPVEHGCGRGPGSREKQTCTARGQVAGALRMSRRPKSPFPKVILFHCITIHKWHSHCVQKIARWIFPPT